MKKIYISPETEVVEMDVNQKLLTGSSSIPIGGETDVVDAPLFDLGDDFLNLISL